MKIFIIFFRSHGGIYACLFPKLDKFIVLLQVVLLSKLGRKGKNRP